jgi:uncharacterized protein (DUF58 family)
MAIGENSSIKELNNLELLANQVVEGFIIGLHKSPFHGFSVEFAEHRIYNQGESTRSLDWKVFARTDKLFTKKYEEETNLRCQLVIDTSSSMFYPVTPKPTIDTKIGFSILAGASLMNLLKKQRDAFGLTLFGDRIQTQTACRSTVQHYQLMLSYFDKVLHSNPTKTGSSITETLHQVADTLHKRSLVIIFSDMFDAGSPEALFSALQHLKHAKHEVILFHVTDKSTEMDFEFENRPYLFIDVESGAEIKLQSGEVKEYYLKQIHEQTEALRQKCLQYKIELVEADIKKGFMPILQTYLAKRNRMGI